jgi:uncharacterized protein (TIGR03435 family)
MLQAQLADRFQLRVHRAVKNLPVYNLVVMRGGQSSSKALGMPRSHLLCGRDGSSECEPPTYA